MTNTTTKYQIIKIVNRIDDPYVYVQYRDVDNFDTNALRSILQYDANHYVLHFVYNGKYVNSTILNENTPIIVELFNDNPQIKFILDNEISNDRLHRL